MTCPTTIGELYTTAASDTLTLTDDGYAFLDGSGIGTIDTLVLYAQPFYSSAATMSFQVLSLFDIATFGITTGSCCQLDDAAFSAPYGATFVGSAEAASLQTLGLATQTPLSPSASVYFGRAAVTQPAAFGATYIAEAETMIPIVVADATSIGLATQPIICVGDCAVAPPLVVGYANQGRRGFGTAAVLGPTASGTANAICRGRGIVAAKTAVSSGAAVAKASVSAAVIVIQHPSSSGAAKQRHTAQGTCAVQFFSANGQCYSVAPSPQAANCFVVNPITLGVWEYSISAIDVTTVDDAVQFLTAEGVLTLDETAPAPAGHIETGDIWFAPGTNCNVSRTELLLNSEGGAYLTAMCDANPVLTTTYQIPERTGEWERARAVRMGRGARGNDWRLKVTTDGGNWRLQGMSVLVEEVGRPR